MESSRDRVIISGDGDYSAESSLVYSLSGNSATLVSGLNALCNRSHKKSRKVAVAASGPKNCV